jgi:hypothetical protein
VEFLDDDIDPADAFIAQRVARDFRTYRAVLSGQVIDVTDRDDPGDEPGAGAGFIDSEDDDLPDDPIVLSYLVTAAMVLPAAERQELLAAPTTGERLLLARSLLHRETGLIAVLSALPALELVNPDPSPN